MSSNVLILLGAALAMYGLWRYIVYPAFCSPLAQLPTPHWSCSMSDLWILRARKHGFENRRLRDAHLRHGRIIRVGPNTVSVDGVDATRAVYQGGFEKWPWYSVFDNYGVPCIFSTLGLREHSRRKRMVSNVYSKSYIQSSATVRVQSHAIVFGRLLPLLRKEASGSCPEGVEVQSVFMATAMDFISAYIFGLGDSTVFLKDEAYRRHWLNLYLCRHQHHFWAQEFPGLTSFCSWLGYRLCPSFVDKANEELRAWNQRLCENAWHSLLKESPKAHHPGDEAVVYKALYQGIEKEERLEGRSSILYATAIKRRKTSITSEVLDQLLAGHETTGIVLTYLCWRLSQRIELQRQLRQELLAISPSMKEDGRGDGVLPDVTKLDGLPLFDAIIMETLRIHAPIPGPQPRITPYPSCNIGGHEIPGGVRIAALAYTLHRDVKVYPDPQRWDHGRWLRQDVTKERQREMNRQFWAFGSGGRTCVGLNFAMNEIKYIVAAIYSNFETSCVNDDTMVQTDGYSARLAKEELRLKFTAL